MSFQAKEQYNISDLVEIMRLLRGENGCPWDREQTHKTIRRDLIEECYETVEAIDADDPNMLREELGDLLMQVVFHSRISEEEGQFDFDGVADGICKKLIYRHTHVFADAAADTSEQVLEKWDELKKKEKGQTTAYQTLCSVPRVFPALMRSQKVQKRAKKAGFDYPDVEMALADLKSEISEFENAVNAGNASDCFEELGDIIFSAVNVARLTGIDAEDSLTASCDKFIARFGEVERLAAEQGVDMKLASLDRLNELWREAKTAQSKNKLK